MTGHTTLVGSLAILSSKGSSHPVVHSMCESRKVRAEDVALAAPRSLARMSPTLSGDRTIFTYGWLSDLVFSKLAHLWVLG